MYCLFVIIYLIHIKLVDANCVDIHNHIVTQGLHYVPGPKPCTLCICDKGNPKWCKQVLCSPPQNCKSFEVGNSCCEYKCLDDILNKSNNYSETYDLALRLIASAVTAVLSLSLLFFLIHRLRQRKIRVRQNRQMNEDQRSLNSIGYITGSLGYLPGSIGYLGSGSNELEYHYDDSNVHYPLWKPPGNYFPRGEAPPPYEEAVRAARAEAEMTNNHNQQNTNITPYTFPASNRNENVNVTLVHNTHVSITPNVSQSQCNVMLHQSNNVLSMHHAPSEVRNETASEIQTNPSTNNGNTNVSSDYVIDSSSNFLPTGTLESQVDVHYENYNHAAVTNNAPIVTVSVKNEESIPKQTLNVDFLRDRIDRGTYGGAIDNKITTGSASIENDYQRNESSALSCSSSWRREATNHCTDAIKPNFNSAQDLRLKNVDKFKCSREPTINATNNLKSYYQTENQNTDIKHKKCNVLTNGPIRTVKSYSGKLNDKQRTILKDHNIEGGRKEVTNQETLLKHRTIPQKFVKSSGTLNTDICYANTSEFIKRKDNCNEYCNTIMKQQNNEKLRYTTERIENRNTEKLNGSRNAQRNVGMLKSDSISSHCTLPKKLRELSDVLYFNFDATPCEGLDCLNKKTLPRNSGLQTETLERKHPAQDKKFSTNGTTTSTSSHSSILNNACCKSQTDLIISTCGVNESDLQQLSNCDREKSCISYRCLSPTQDDIDDYRSECENCKSLSFEDCNDEEGDVLNETMTLQRRPIEQGEEHSFYRTSLTLPSHSKKPTRSVTLNTPRESWFMAMQEMTSSSESDE